MSTTQGGFLLPVAIVAAVAASPLRPGSFRDTGLVLVGMVFAAVAANNQWKLLLGRNNRRTNSERRRTPADDEQHTIRTIEELRSILPVGTSGASLEDAPKVIGYLDDQMISYIAKSPLLYIATVDQTTMTPFVSPKGDQPGFVTVLSSSEQQHTLVVPDRPGNRLLFGLQNIVAGGQSSETTTSTTQQQRQHSSSSSRVSVLFEVPGTCTTLRCGGNARLSTDPVLLEDHKARGLVPKIVILIDVDHAFFHCAKAYMRSRVWDPKSWPPEPCNVTFGRYFARKGSLVANGIDSVVDNHYQKVQKAINGESCEVEG